jgi:hypothetical protein
MNGMDMEGGGRVVGEILSPHLPEGTKEDLRIAAVSAEIRTEHLPNTREKATGMPPR